MGVINVTPNSFSDPSLFYLNDNLKKVIAGNTTRRDFLFDFGMESTAPMNAPITGDEERARFDQFFDLIKDIDLNDRWISFDTYRTESFRYFESRFKSHYQGQGFLFNDVSGVIDDELKRLLEERKTDPSFRYLYSYTHIPSREETGKHMSYLKEGDIIERARTHFKRGEQIFSKLGVSDQVVFDPCFGFSKTYEQNWELIRGFSMLKNSFGEDRSWLIGLSKKSFLRKALPPETKDLFAEAEKLHESLLAGLIAEPGEHVFFRVHDFDIVNRAYDLNRRKNHA